MFSSKRLSEQLGAEISGLDLSRPLSDTVLRSFLEVFYQNCVVVVREWSLDLERFNRFASHFGRPKPHFLDHLRFPGFDAILLLSNIHENGKPKGIYGGAAF